MVAAMVSIFMLKQNPKKKVLFVCDRIPLVFQQAEYLRKQCNYAATVNGVEEYTVGEFCSETRELVSSQLNCDILVFTLGFLYNNVLFTNQLSMKECCCLIIDEVHHAITEESLFRKLINDFVNPLKDDYRPLLLGLTASPSASAKSPLAIHLELDRLSAVIGGEILMPAVYRTDFESLVTRPDVHFIECQKDPNEEALVACIDGHSRSLLTSLARMNRMDFSSVSFDRKNMNLLKSVLNKALKKSNVELKQRENLVAGYLLRLVESIEIMCILGLDKAVESIQSLVNSELEKEKKSQRWSSSELSSMKQLLETLRSKFQQPDINSNHKLSKLCQLLKDDALSAGLQPLTQVHRDQEDDSDLDSDDWDDEAGPSNLVASGDSAGRVIVFVKQRKTARKIHEHLAKDSFIREYYNPTMVVGHEDMDWLGGQEPVIREFCEGRSRLIVSTSVLQEGIDVPVCNKVILFDKTHTLTQYVQSRGRARHVASKLVVIGKTGDRDHYQHLVSLEASLKQAVYSRSNSTQSWSVNKRLVDHLIKTSEESSHDYEAYKRVKDEDNFKWTLARNEEEFNIDLTSRSKQFSSIRFVLEVNYALVTDDRKPAYFQLNNRWIEVVSSGQPVVSDSGDLKLRLLGLLHSQKGFVQADDQQDIQPVTSSEPDTSVNLSKLVCNFEFKVANSPTLSKVRMSELYHQHSARSVRYLLGGVSSDICFITLQSMNEAQRLSIENVQVFCGTVQFGNVIYAKRFLFDPLSPLNARFGQAERSLVKIQIKFDKRTVLVLALVGSTFLKFEMPFSSLDKYAFISDEPDASADDSDMLDIRRFDLYLLLKRPALVYSATLNEKGGALNFSNAITAGTQFSTLSEQNFDWERLAQKNESGWSLRLEANTRERAGLERALRGIAGLKLANSNISVQPISSASDFVSYDTLRMCLKTSDFDVRYNLECLLTQHEHHLYGRLGPAFLGTVKNLLDCLAKSSQPPDLVKDVLASFIFRLDSCFDLHFLHLDRTLLAVIQSELGYYNLKVREAQTQGTEKLQTMMVYHATITPSKTVFHLAQENVSNRVLREFGAKNFLRVRFKDENLSKLGYATKDFYDMSSVYVAIRNTVGRGIRVAGRNFEFLAMSSSQLREHGCWFFAKSMRLDANYNSASVTADQVSSAEI